MRIRLTLRRDPAEAKDLAVTVDGLATVADIATQLWAADPARRGTPPPSNLSLSIEEAFAAGGMKRQRPGPRRTTCSNPGCGRAPSSR